MQALENKPGKTGFLFWISGSWTIFAVPIRCHIDSYLLHKEFAKARAATRVPWVPIKTSFGKIAAPQPSAFALFSMPFSTNLQESCSERAKPSGRESAETISHTTAWKWQNHFNVQTAYLVFGFFIWFDPSSGDLWTAYVEGDGVWGREGNLWGQIGGRGYF